MKTRGGTTQRAARARGSFQRRLMLIFGMQLVAVVLVCLMGFYDVAPFGAVLGVIVIVGGTCVASGEFAGAFDRQLE
jgi:two-component system sensor histidine kinase QseC